MASQLLNPKVQTAPNVDRPDTKYVALAKRLHVNVATVPSDMLLRKLLEEQSIAIYSLAAVSKYLISKRPVGHQFLWVPAVGRQETPRTLRSKYPQYRSGMRRHGYIADSTQGQYNKPIPYPVLLTIEKVVNAAKKMGFQPTFYVSDYAVSERLPERSNRFDPFLAVGTSDSDALFVIERWDEPGFREEVYSKKRKAKASTKKGK